MSNLFAPLVLTLSLAQVPANPPAAKVDRYGDPLPAGAVARLGTVRFRPTHPVDALVVAPDGKTAVAVQNGEVHFWELATGKNLRRFTDDGRALLLAFADNGKTLLTLSETGVLRYRDMPEGRVAHEASLVKTPPRWRGDGSAVFTHDGRFLAFKDLADKSVGIWDVSARAEKKRIKSEKYESGPVAVSRDGKSLAFGKTNIEIWDVETGKFRRTLPEYPTIVANDVLTADSLGFSHDGSTLFTVGSRWSYSWDASTGELVAGFGPTPTSNCSFAISADDKRLAIMHAQHGLRVWDLVRVKEVWKAPNSGGVMAFTPDGKTLVTGGRTLSQWDTAGTEIRKDQEAQSAFYGLTASADGRWLAALGNNEDRTLSRLHTTMTGGLITGKKRRITNDMLVLWDTDTQTQTAKFSGALSRYQFSPDGNLFAYRNKDAEVRLCETASGKQVDWQADTLSAVANLAFDAQGKTLITAHADATVRLRKTSDGMLVRTNALLPPDLNRPAIDYQRLSCDGHVLLARLPGDNEPYRFWLTGSGRRLSEIALATPTTFSHVLSADGRHVTMNDATGAASIYETASGAKRATLRHDESKRQDSEIVSFCAFAPDSRLLAARGAENLSIDLWDLATNQHVHRIHGVQGYITGLCFAGNDRLATAGEDTTILVWDLREVRKKLPVFAAPSSEEIGKLWQDLASHSPQRSIWKLAAGGEAVVKFLRTQLRPADAPSTKEIAERIRQLDDASYLIRQQGTRQLEQWGELVLPTLRDSIMKDSSLELRRRTERLLDKIATGPLPEPTPARLREIRGLEVLEHIGSAAAIELLSDLARGAPGALLTQDAEATVKRLRGPRF